MLKSKMLKSKLMLSSESSQGTALSSSPLVYRLAALIEHVGFTPHSGHYMAYKRLIPESLNSKSPKKVRKPKSKWVRANDSKISIINEKEVLSRV